jgi:DHA1 family multidrug resistance protein-like MFS transporter
MTKKDKLFDKTLISMLVMNVLSNSCYTLIPPFLPFMFRAKGADPSLLGYVFAIYSLSVILFSPVVGLLVNKIGRRPIILFGVLMYGTSFFLYASSSYIESVTLYTIDCFMIRII